MTETAIEKYQTFKKQYEETKKKFVNEATVAFKDIAADIFNEFPELVSFGWTQYTPYFNDGDTCEFSVNAWYDSVFINNIRDGYDEDSDPDKLMNAEDRTKAAKSVSDMLNMFEEFILQDIYGDHCKVTIHRDGKAQIDGYDHD